MTRTRLRTVVERGMPFSLRTNDGREYPVPRGEQISLPEGVPYLFVYSDGGHLTVLPLRAVAAVASWVEEIAGSS